MIYIFCVRHALDQHNEHYVLWFKLTEIGHRN